MIRATDRDRFLFFGPAPAGAGLLLFARYTVGMLCAVLLLGCSSSIQEPPNSLQAKLTSLLDEKRAEFDVPALGAVVVADGKIVAYSAVGTRKYGEEIPVTIHDKFHIGSNTKAMTAALCALLVKEGKLSWDTKASDVLSGLVFPDELRGATLAHSLTHRSGLIPNVPFSAATKPETIREARLRYAQMALNLKPAGGVGEQFAYSNAGYVLAGAMIEKITGKDWEEVIREKLFEPIGMKSAGFGVAGEAAKNDQPWPHSVRGGAPSPGPYVDNNAVLGPAGTVHMSAEDYGKWMLFVLKHGPKLLTSAEFDALHTPSMGGDYAFGWLRANRGWGGGHVLNHAGSNTLNFFVAWIAPAKDFGVAIFTNVSGDVGPRVTDSVAADVVTNMDEWRLR